MRPPITVEENGGLFFFSPVIVLDLIFWLVGMIRLHEMPWSTLRSKDPPKATPTVSPVPSGGADKEVTTGPGGESVVEASVSTRVPQRTYSLTSYSPFFGYQHPGATRTSHPLPSASPLIHSPLDPQEPSDDDKPPGCIRGGLYNPVATGSHFEDFPPVTEPDYNYDAYDREEESNVQPAFPRSPDQWEEGDLAHPYDLRSGWVAGAQNLNERKRERTLDLEEGGRESNPLQRKKARNFESEHSPVRAPEVGIVYE